MAERASRLESIDLLRGIVMAVMALDHARDFFHLGMGDPTDLRSTTPALFLTRWITHFCAPTFVFLAGTGAYFYGSHGRTKGELARFLVSRGLWLALLDLTIVRLGFGFGGDFRFLGFIVLWALGWSMVCLAGLAFLPVPAIAAIGVGMIAGHNLLDGVRGDDLGLFRIPFAILHEQRPLDFGGGWRAFVFYPLVPWIGVMAAGYAFGALY